VFKGRVVLITGGTGSFGKVMTEELLKRKVKRIVIYSRDEQKQMEMAEMFRNSRIEYYIGNVRDYKRVSEVRKEVKPDIVYHAGAMKIIPFVEDNIMEGVKTNVIGGYNVAKACVEMDVGCCICISTDKACMPTNMYGATKMLQEGIFLQFGWNCVRYGNVLGSRGSVVPYFISKAEKGESLPLTHKDMTRFMLTLKDAVKLVIEATLDFGEPKIFVPKCSAFEIRVLAEVVSEYYGVGVEDIGIRKGEKLHETLIHYEELYRAKDLDRFYIIKLWDRSKEPLLKEEYTSKTADKLSYGELKELLIKEGWLDKHREMEDGFRIGA